MESGEGVDLVEGPNKKNTTLTSLLWRIWERLQDPTAPYPPRTRRGRQRSTETNPPRSGHLSTCSSTVNRSQKQVGNYSWLKQTQEAFGSLGWGQDALDGVVTFTKTYARSGAHTSPVVLTVEVVAVSPTSSSMTHQMHKYAEVDR